MNSRTNPVVHETQWNGNLCGEEAKLVLTLHQTPYGTCRWEIKLCTDWGTWGYVSLDGTNPQEEFPNKNEAFREVSKWLTDQGFCYVSEI